MANQKLLSNKDLMLRNFAELSANLRACEDYVDKVIVRDIYVIKDSCLIYIHQGGREKPDDEIGKALVQCMSQFSEDDMAVLESIVKENFHDAIMINSLAKLQHAQITMSEKLNNIFSQSLSR